MPLTVGGSPDQKNEMQGWRGTVSCDITWCVQASWEEGRCRRYMCMSHSIATHSWLTRRFRGSWMRITLALEHGGGIPCWLGETQNKEWDGDRSAHGKQCCVLPLLAGMGCRMRGSVVIVLLIWDSGGSSCTPCNSGQSFYTLHWGSTDCWLSLKSVLVTQPALRHPSLRWCVPPHFSQNNALPFFFFKLLVWMLQSLPVSLVL